MQKIHLDFTSVESNAIEWTMYTNLMTWIINFHVDLQKTVMFTNLCVQHVFISSTISIRKLRNDSWGKLNYFAHFVSLSHSTSARYRTSSRLVLKNSTFQHSRNNKMPLCTVSIFMFVSQQKSMNTNWATYNIEKQKNISVTLLCVVVAHLDNRLLAIETWAWQSFYS